MSAPNTKAPLVNDRPLPLRMLIGGRSAVAALTLVTPHRGGRLFLIPVEGTPAPAMMRMFGVRNAVLAAGLYRLDLIAAARTFVRINVLVDLVDALAFIAAGRRREISPAATALCTGVALSAVVMGAAAQAAMAPDDRASRSARP